MWYLENEGQCPKCVGVYECPKVEIVEVCVEQGFCVSGELSSGNENYTPVTGAWDERI